MKKLLPIAIVSISLLTSIKAIAAIAVIDSEKTTCYIFNNNQLTQKFDCNYSGSFGHFLMPVSYKYDEDRTEYNFTVNGLGKMHVKLLENVPNQDGADRLYKITAQLNGKKAKVSYRNSQLKPIKKPKNSVNTLTCLKAVETTNEFCYVKRY